MMDYFVQIQPKRAMHRVWPVKKKEICSNIIKRTPDIEQDEVDILGSKANHSVEELIAGADFGAVEPMVFARRDFAAPLMIGRAWGDFCTTSKELVDGDE